MNRAMPSTLVDRIWEGDLVREESAEPALLYVDLQLVHDVTSLEAFAPRGSPAAASAGR